jgi:hypothetical protein
VRDVVALSDPDGPLSIRAIEPWGRAGFVAVGAGTRGAAAWHSADGEAWQRVPDGDVFHTPGEASMYGLAAGDELIGVGIGDSETLAAVWTSPDGATWRRSFESGAEQYPGGMTGVASAQGLAVAVGLALPDPNVEEWIGAAWTSTDPTEWKPVEDGGAVSPRALFAVRAGGPGFVAVGGIGGAVVASSPDGQRWSIADLGADAPQTELRSLAVGPGGRMLAVGSLAGTMLSSPDGTAWTWLRCANAERRPSFRAIGAGPAGFIAAGSDSVGSVLWRSDDGATWESISDLPMAEGSSITAVAVGTGLAVLAGTNMDGSAAMWAGPADGRGEHPVGQPRCQPL